jgi:4-hydroxy-4-methyl-2-oxoglutarate aldolase
MPDELTSIKQASVPTISDALDVLGINGACKDLLPVSDSLSCVGRAFTVEFEAAACGTPAPAADYIDEVPTGAVIVLDNQGRTDCTVWGDLLSRFAQQRGIEGTVINGCCRDIDEIRRLKFAVFSWSRYMKSGKNRVRLKSYRRPVLIRGTVVNPNDIVCGDGSGVIVIPESRLREVADLVGQIQATEENILADLKAGLSMKEARQKNNYNRFALSMGAKE